MTPLDPAWLAAHPLPDPGKDTDKNSRGRVLVAGSSRTVPGAILLTGEAALRAGAGKLQLASVEGSAGPLGIAMPEAAVFPLLTADDGELGEDAGAALLDYVARCDALVFGPGMGATAPAEAILRALLAELPAHNARRERMGEIEDARGRAWQKLSTLKPQVALLEAIRAELPEDGLFVDELTQLGYASRALFPVYAPRTFLSPGYQGTLGWGMAAALGAQVAKPGTKVVSVIGDGGFLFNAQELATAVQHRIPLVTVLANDDAFGNVRRIQDDQYGGRRIASDLRNPDFVRLADSYGALALRANGPDELRAALSRAFREDGPSVIEVPVGPMPDPWTMLRYRSSRPTR